MTVDSHGSSPVETRPTLPQSTTFNPPTQFLVHHMREEEEVLLPRFAATEGVTQDTLVRRFECAPSPCCSRRLSLALENLHTRFPHPLMTPQPRHRPPTDRTSCQKRLSWSRGWRPPGGTSSFLEPVNLGAVEIQARQLHRPLAYPLLSTNQPTNPTRPHPMAPAKPFFANLAASVAVAPLDYALDLIRFQGAPPL